MGFQQLAPTLMSSLEVFATHDPIFQKELYHLIHPEHKFQSLSLGDSFLLGKEHARKNPIIPSEKN
jgi:hypothetical protein